jgi:hypothetical protein
MNKTIFLAAMLALTTVLAAGLTVLPSTVQEAQANPCSTQVEQNTEIDSDTTTITSATNQNPGGSTDNRECNFGPGPVEFDED